MSATILERDMLKTRVPERDMSVTTYMNQHVCYPMRHPWTSVWFGERAQLVWLHFWQGPTTAGGLGEAHESIVDQVKKGQLPAQDADDPAPTPLIRGALSAGGALADGEEVER